ncbi:Eco57I restriction-modification methylase domain-containing protein [Sedimentisphaera salicampi]|uniref:site-specific DNA-methyltransferase (adenine-specific) n=1 Tax=Sedimentisphaera salicampi TaxID=1941349 RepID=A0A1W6LL57_9BACT|nr:Eco57I restriction-modification methylase domain-containing protein [Sedimentisphaera salicampi]ARN56483.1 Eco57I restriction-modification methylase [Sedimentisphaera salicampi]
MDRTNYNPDVLNCLANLSNDEVFTPPKLVNEMLDLLPPEIWKDKNAAFLDPVCKTGVFLREIAKRLTEGLKDEIPDLQERVNHIFRNQIFGIAITELTGLVSRRSVYCSKKADGKYSVCNEFQNEQGNILFNPCKHNWRRGRCTFCGAAQAVYERDDELEAHAYQFIHTEKPEDIFNMKFDVIVGNPPYQLSDGGAQASAIPLYHKFVQQAKKLKPRYLTMIIPSRWFAGGKGLNEFREEMLHDKRIRKLVDFPSTSDCFPGDVKVEGGVCYFLWDRDYSGNCEVKSIIGNEYDILERPLLERNSDIFIRYNKSANIFRKVNKKNEKSFSEYVSSRKPFGLPTNFQDYYYVRLENHLKLYANKKTVYVDTDKIIHNNSWINKHKILISMAYGMGNAKPYQVINKPFYAEPNSCCTETYLVIGPFDSKEICENVISYIKTKFFRFLVLLRKNTQHAAKGVYQFVPIQDFNEPWTDEKLYKKYGLDEEEISFIESMIRPMEMDNE